MLKEEQSKSAQLSPIVTSSLFSEKTPRVDNEDSSTPDEKTNLPSNKK